MGLTFNPLILIGFDKTSTGGGGGGVSSVSASAPLSSSGGTTPDISFTGVLSPAHGGTGVNNSTHTLTINSNSVISGNSTGTNSGDVTLSAVGSSPNGNAATITGQTLNLQPADGSNPGVLSTGAQTIAGNKTFTGTVLASNISGSTSGTNTGDQTITLTGDVTGSGTGSFATILATVNGNVGSFGSSTSIPTFTVNAKGLITAASGNVVIAPAGTLSGTTLNSTVVNSSLTSLGVQAQALNMGSHLINNVTDPSAAQDAATKNYVDTAGGAFANKTLSNLTSPTAINQALLPDATLTRDLGSAASAWNRLFVPAIFTTGNKEVVDINAQKLYDLSTLAAVDWVNRRLVSDTTIKLDWSGTNIDVNTRKIINVVDPTAAQDAATKNYVDTHSGTGITALTGDVTATGPGSAAATLATVNGNVGSFGSSTSIPNFTVNAKGLITAAGSNVVIAPAGTLTGTTLASNVVSSSLTSVGTITSGTWNGTTIAIANGGTGQTTANSAFNALSPMTTAGDIIYENSTPVAARLPIGTAGQVLTVSGGLPSWQTAATSLTIGTINSQSKSANGLVISGSSLVAQTADSSFPGMLSIVAQNITGEKTFSNALVNTQISTPSNPSAGLDKLYFKSDDLLYALDSSGNERVIGPGMSGTNWKNDLTFTFDNTGTNSNTDTRYRRVGDSMEIYGTTTFGTVAAGTFAITFPSGYTIDSTKLTSSSNVQHRGYVWISGGASVTYASTSGGPFPIFWDGSTNNKLFSGGATSGGVFQKSNSNGLFASNDIISFSFTVPITGWTVNNAPNLPFVGMAGSDWTSYVPTFTGLGTVSNNNIFYRRVGDTLEVQGTVTTGTASGTTFTVTLPSGLSIDSTKMSATGNGSNVGISYNGDNTGLAYGSGVGMLFYDGSDVNNIYVAKNATTSFTKGTGSGVFNDNATATINFEVPIQGWTTNNGPGATGFQFYASSQVTTDASVSSTSFTTFSNSPALTFTPTYSGKYKVYSSVPLFLNPAVATEYGVIRIFNTTGGGTLLYESQGTNGEFGTTETVSTATIQSVYTLTAGVSYVFDIQAKTVTSGSSSISNIGTKAPFYVFAELCG